MSAGSVSQVLWAALLFACAPQNEGQVGLLTPPVATFPLVADALQPGCGTLDCHGQIGRNLRLFGARGLRLDPRHNSAEEATTDAEYAASFRSVTGLEPETLDAVVRRGGAAPEDLTLLRKAGGSERHRGGVQLLPGDPLDRCLRSWLASQPAAPIDQMSCRRVAEHPRPPLPGP